MSEIALDFIFSRSTTLIVWMLVLITREHFFCTGRSRSSSLESSASRYAAGEFGLDWISHERCVQLKNQGLLVAEGEPIFVSPGEDWSELSK